MNKLLVFTVISLYFSGLLLAQPTIYDDNSTLVTGFWNTNGTLSEVSANSPYEGSLHYAFAYNYTEFWSGIGLNFDNWGTTAGIDISNYTHLRMAYRGMSGVQELQINFNSASGAGNVISAGIPTTNYTVIEIPLFSFRAGNNLDLADVTDFYISVTGSDANGSGTLYFDQIELVNTTTGVSTSAATWSRFSDWQRGINLSNWLEAYWLIPFNTFPDTDKFTEQSIIDFRNLGITTFRLPVTFENLAGMAAPYTLDTNHPAIGLLDDAIAWAANQNVKLIIDMHHGEDLTDANFQTQLPRLEAIWEQIMDHYGDLDPDRYFFEIYNEPHAISNENFRTVARALVDVVRANETGTHSIIVGATGYNSIESLLSFTPLSDADIIYTFHFYDPYNFTHQQMSWTSNWIPARAFPIGTDEDDVTSIINAAGEWKDFYNVPLFAGEFGASQQAALQDRCNWISTITNLLDNNSLPWFYWGAIDVSDGFGFFTNAEISTMAMESCFGTALGLPATILPVTDISPLVVECGGSSTQLSWSLTTDEPAKLTLEGFDEGEQKWQYLGQQTAELERRSYIQRIASSNHAYYRLKIEEVDGSAHYTHAVANPCQGERPWKVFPTPSTGEYFWLETTLAGNALVQLFSQQGQLLMSWSELAVSNGVRQRIDLPDLPSGSYWLRIQHDRGSVAWERLVLQR